VCCMCVEVGRGSTFRACSQENVTRRPGSLRRRTINRVSKYVHQNVYWNQTRAGNTAALLSEAERNFVVGRNVAWCTLTLAVDSGSGQWFIRCFDWLHACNTGMLMCAVFLVAAWLRYPADVGLQRGRGQQVASSCT
jgi:hypothetical protein